MRNVLRVSAIFATLFLGAAVVLYLGIPELSAWTQRSCMGRQSYACSSASVVLSYWWLALLPALVLLTAFANWLLVGRRPS